jgi:extradiol dioxygenase family protein
VADVQLAGSISWIDHYVVPTGDLTVWSEFYTNVLGAAPRWADRRNLLFTHLGRCHVGASPSKEPIAPSQGLGVGRPRYSWFIRPEEIAEHLRRLDVHEVPHSGPLTTSEEGEPGTAIRFVDPDGNQLEFWAPATMPEAAMADETDVKVGRIANAAFGSRDLDRTVEFYGRYCGLAPLRSNELDRRTIVFPLAGGGRLVFNEVAELGDRTGGHMKYQGVHTALVIRDDVFLPAFEAMYRDLPEWDHDPNVVGTVPAAEAQALPARTGLHGSPIGPQWKAAFGRGESFFDWDTNAFHYINAAPVDGSMATFEPVSQRAYVERRLAQTAF